jgi:predicted nicotinamide N-methyase
VHIGSHVNMFAGSTGCFEWDAGYLLCEFVLNNVSLFQGRTVVDIGCGTGMATIVLAQLRRSGVLACGPIVCSDGDAWDG